MDSLIRPLPDGPPGHRDASGRPWPDLDTAAHMRLYLNAQNLVARWNNIIVAASSGDEQLQWMRESGIFADDVRLVFAAPGGETLSFTGLQEPRDFYAGFVDPLKKQRLNVAANVEVLAFYDHGLRFRFRHFILMGGRVSLCGYNEVVMRERDRFVIEEATINVVLWDTDHAY